MRQPEEHDGAAAGRGFGRPIERRIAPEQPATLKDTEKEQQECRQHEGIFNGDGAVHVRPARSHRVSIHSDDGNARQGGR